MGRGGESEGERRGGEGRSLGISCEGGRKSCWNGS